MLDKRTLHMKVQEHCDCFAETDPLSEMGALVKEHDPEDGALKWIALAVSMELTEMRKKSLFAAPPKEASR